MTDESLNKKICRGDTQCPYFIQKHCLSVSVTCLLHVQVVG